MNKNLPEQSATDKRQACLIQLILADKNDTPISELGKLAGYSEYYANGNLYKMINTPTFKNELINAAKVKELAQSPRILRISKKALKTYEKHDGLVIEKPGLYQNLRRDIGLSKPEEGTKTNVLNIKQLTVIRQGLQGYVETPENIEDAEVVEPEPSVASTKPEM